ncbi:MAG: hypothetical protein AB7D27_07170 [Desulfomicrobium sp.]
MTLHPRILWILLLLLFPLPALAANATTILFTANSLGEIHPCPS